MTDRRVLAGLAFGAALLAASVGASTLSLPDVAGAPGGSVSTQLQIDSGNGVAAMNVSVLFNPTVATPNQPGITVGSAIDGTWTVRSNVLSVNATQSDLRIVVYHSPTATFSNSAANRVIVNIPWNVVGAAGTSTALDFTNPVNSGRCGLSNATGGSIGSLNLADGRILSLTPPTRTEVTGGFEDLTTWTSFQAIPWPLTDPFDNDYMNASTVAGPALQLQSTADGTRDGLAGFLCVVPIEWVANSVYLCEYTLQNDLVPGQNETQFRMRLDEEVKNAFAEMLITGFTSSRLGGSTVTYPQFFEPSNLAANQGPGDTLDDLFLTFDMVDFDDSAAMTLRLTAVDVARFSKPQVDAAFADSFTVTDFTSAGQWLLGTYGIQLDADPLEDVPLPAAPLIFGTKTEFESLPTYSTTTSVVTAGSILVPTDTDSIGFFQEFGIPSEAPPQQDPGAIWRQIVEARLPAGGTTDPQADRTGAIRLRMTEETQALSVLYQVEPMEPRAQNPGFASAATGSNRPVSNADRTYVNYLAYPETTNVEALLNSTSTDDILAFVGLIDFSEALGGNVEFRNARMQTAPRNALLP